MGAFRLVTLMFNTSHASLVVSQLHRMCPDVSLSLLHKLHLSSVLRVIRENPSRKKKSPTTRAVKIGKQMAKPLGPCSRNNGSQAHEINKWVLKRQVSLKKPEKREIAYPWVVDDVKSEKGSPQSQSNANKESKGFMAGS